MSFDLTAAPDGTLRTLGTATFTYDAANGRWVRNPNPSGGSPIATITATWDGYPGKVVSGQYVTVTTSWNKAFTNSLFTQANTSIVVSANGTSSVLANSFVYSADPNTGFNTYIFKYTFSGAYSQIQIPANQFTVNSLPNLTGLSPVIPGVYLPYALLTPVAKSNSGPVYSFSDPNYAGVTRYFANNLIATTPSTTTRRLAVTFQNFTSVLNTGAGLTSTKITGNTTSVGANAYVNILNGGISTANIRLTLNTVANTTAYGNTAANTLSNPRYWDLYQTSAATANTNIINRFVIPLGTYQDGGTNNDTGLPLYFASLPNNAITVVPYYNRASGFNVNKISLFLDHYTAMVATANSANVTAQYGTLSNFVIDTTDPSGTSYAVTYTPNTSNGDYVETITIKANTFIVPAPTSNISLNGLTLSYDANGSVVTANVWSNSRTNILTTGTFNVVQTLLSPTSYTANQINITRSTLTFSRNVFTSTPATGTYTIFDRNNNIVWYQGNTGASIAITGGSTVTIGNNSSFGNTTPYYTKIDAGSLRDDYGNFSTVFGIASSVISANSGFTIVNGANAINTSTATLKLLAPFGRTYLNNISTLYSSNISVTSTGTGTGTISNIRNDPSDTNSWLFDYNANTSDTGVVTFQLKQGTSGGLQYQYPAGSGLIYNSVASNVSFSYDTTNISVSSTNPTNGQTGVATIPFNIIFTKSMNVASINASSITVVKGSSYAGGTPIAFTTSYTTTTNTNDTISITPTNLTSLSLGDQIWINLAANTVYDSYNNPSSAYGPYSFTLTATTPANSVIYSSASGPTTKSFVCPLFVTSVSVLTVGGSYNSVTCPPGPGGGGGGLSYKNNIPVVPGLTYTVYTGNSDYCYFANGSTKLCIAYSSYSQYGGKGGMDASLQSGVIIDGGGNGGNGGNYFGGTAGGGGGAGGYSGSGGNGYDASIPQNATGAAIGSGGGAGGNAGLPGGGVGLFGQGADGVVGMNGGGGSGATGQNYGGGADGNGFYPFGAGAVRIVWGTGRSFPSSNVSTQ